MPRTENKARRTFEVIQQGYIDRAARAANPGGEYDGAHEPRTHYDRYGNCLCTKKCCFGDAGCRCKGCSGESHEH